MEKEDKKNQNVTKAKLTGISISTQALEKNKQKDLEKKPNIPNTSKIVTPGNTIPVKTPEEKFTTVDLEKPKEPVQQPEKRAPEQPTIEQPTNTKDGSEEPKKKKNKLNDQADTNQEPQGHYKENNSFFLIGLVLANTLLLIPLGGSFSCILVPAQALSFTLIPYVKKCKNKVFVLDKKQVKSLDKLVSENEKGSSLVTTKEQGDKLATPVLTINNKEMAENFFSVLNPIIGTEINDQDSQILGKNEDEINKFLAENKSMQEAFQNKSKVDENKLKVGIQEVLEKISKLDGISQELKNSLESTGKNAEKLGKLTEALKGVTSNSNKGNSKVIANPQNTGSKGQTISY